MTVLPNPGLWELLIHLKKWLTNLKRAGDQRKSESVAALRAVILACRQTTVYVRQLQATGTDHPTERDLSSIWTELGFALADLGLTKLAKRCDITGRYWSNPHQFDGEFLDKADINLETMEKMARQLLAGIDPTAEH